MSRPQTPIPEDAPTTMEVDESATAGDVPPEVKSRSRKSGAPDTFSREPGKSLLPYARVQKILKADKELVMVQREAAFLISRATEEFIHRIAEAAQNTAAKERRTTVQSKDLVASVRRAEEFAFLEELLPWLEPGPAPSGRRNLDAEQGREKSKQASKLKNTPTMLDQFVKRPRNDGSLVGEDEDAEPQTNFVMNEDGTMSMIPVEASL